MSVAAFTLERPDFALALRGVRVLLGGPESAAAVGTTAELNGRVDHFLAFAGSTQLDIKRQVVALNGERAAGGTVRSMCLWVPSPGRTALLFVPSLSEFPEIAGATTAAVGAAIDDARGFGIRMAQAMVEPADAATKTAFAEAGMLQLSTLTYMERRAPSAGTVGPLPALPEGFSLVPFTEERAGMFQRAILESYERTLDCPALAGMRDPEDVIDGHKGAGPFDPQLWSLLMRGEEPVGCLLLANVPARRALELVYLGLSPGVRGLGLGAVLLKRVLAAAAAVGGCEIITLAVDANNAPAIRIYRRMGFTATAQRVAFVRKLG